MNDGAHLQELSTNYPSTDQLKPGPCGNPKSVIVYLIRGTSRSLKSFKKSVDLLKVNFLPYNPSDIIVFHENNILGEKIKVLCEGVDIKTARLDFSDVPAEFLDHPTSLEFGLGYRHMCHFFANDYFFLHPQLDGYDYAMRLDDDSFILSPLKYNVFKLMREKSANYAYRVVDDDSEIVCRGLMEVTRSFFDAHPDLLKGRLPSCPPYKCYYTNFEICDLAWFRSDDWQSFFKEIDKAGGIWRTRWGDAPIRYLGVTGLLPSSRILCVRDLHYQHQAVWMPGDEKRPVFRNLYWYVTRKTPWICVCLKPLIDWVPFLSKVMKRFRDATMSTAE